MVYRYAMNMTRFHDIYRALAQWLQFTDKGQIATWANDALRWLNMHGIVTGSTTTTINPTGTATRAETAVMLMRFVERLTNPLVCSGCGDERSYWIPGDDENIEDNAVTLVLTHCVSARDNRDWTLNDFGNIAGALYLEDLSRLSDREWELIQDGRWQETFVNWPQFRRSMRIRLDQNCKENVANVIRQLHQYEFIRSVGPNSIPEPA